jgi:hypothetical protein
MIQASVVQHELSHQIDFTPPLLLLHQPEHMRKCVGEICSSFDLKVREILFGRPPDKTYVLYFRKAHQARNEVFEASIGFDSAWIKSENFSSEEEITSAITRLLDTVIGQSETLPTSQNLTYQAHLTIKSGDMDEYLAGILDVKVTAPGNLKTKGVILGFDGPTPGWATTLVLANSQVVPNGLFLSVQSLLTEQRRDFREVYEAASDFFFKSVLPAVGVEIVAGGE